MSAPIVVLFTGVLVVIVALGLSVLGATSPRSRLRKRAERIARGSRTGLPAPAGKAGSIRRTEKTTLRGLETLAGRLLPRQSLLRDRLARTGHSVSLGTYAMINLIVGGVAFAATALLGGTPPIAALVAVAGGAGLPHFAVGLLGARRSKRFLAVLPDAIDLIVRGLRSGLPVAESMTAVANEMADPVGSEFRRITDNIRLGGSLDEVLLQTAARLDLPEFNFFVISLSIQRETGGNLAETLANLSDIIRRRRQMRLKVKALSGEARASAMILGSLPFIMFAIVYTLSPDYAGGLFRDPRGLMMTGVGLISMLIGIAVMAKMVRFEI